MLQDVPPLPYLTSRLREGQEEVDHMELPFTPTARKLHVLVLLTAYWMQLSHMATYLDQSLENEVLS